LKNLGKDEAVQCFIQALLANGCCWLASGNFTPTFFFKKQHVQRWLSLSEQTKEMALTTKLRYNRPVLPESFAKFLCFEATKVCALPAGKIRLYTLMGQVWQSQPKFR